MSTELATKPTKTPQKLITRLLGKIGIEHSKANDLLINKEIDNCYSITLGKVRISANDMDALISQIKRYVKLQMQHAFSIEFISGYSFNENATIIKTDFEDFKFFASNIGDLLNKIEDYLRIKKFVKKLDNGKISRPINFTVGYNGGNYWEINFTRKHKKDFILLGQAQTIEVTTNYSVLASDLNKIKLRYRNLKELIRQYPFRKIEIDKNILIDGITVNI